MIEKVKELLAIKDENGDFVIDANEVAEAQDKSLNAVYTSRKGECKLDKLTAFDKIKKLIELNEKGQFALNGDKDGVLNGLNDVLKNNTRYEINFKEV
jgi:hypothetical protein